MTSSSRIIPLALTLAFAAVGAQAQSTNSSYAPARADRTSIVPYTQNGYVGISGGRSKYELNSGPAGFGFESDNSDSALKLSTGGYFNKNFGVEIGYINAGKVQRLGGDTKAQGFNLSLIGRAPLSEQFDLFGKVGTTYSRTKTSGFAATGVRTGSESGFGLSYGVGARWAFSPQWAAVVEWENHRFKFADANSDVKLTTVGLQYRF